MCCFLSHNVYGGRLVCGTEKVARQGGSPDHVNAEVSNFVRTITKKPCVFYATYFHEERSDDSYINRKEADSIVSHVMLLRCFSVPLSSVCVISGYSAQVQLIRELLRDNSLEEVKVVTIDSFQGNECDVVLLSFVRDLSNCHTTYPLNFLHDTNRVNVMLSRGKVCLLAFGNPVLLSASAILRSLVRYSRTSESGWLYVG